jgi:hypothetical protein
MSLKWIFLNLGTWRSGERFYIYPEYMGTTRPQGYRLEDHETGVKSTHDTIAHAKRHAGKA